MYITYIPFDRPFEFEFSIPYKKLTRTDFEPTTSYLPCNALTTELSDSTMRRV